MLGPTACLSIRRDNWIAYKDKFGKTCFALADVYDSSNCSNPDTVVICEKKYSCQWCDSGDGYYMKKLNGPYDSMQEAFEEAYELYEAIYDYGSELIHKEADREWVTFGKMNDLNIDFLYKRWSPFTKLGNVQMGKDELNSNIDSRELILQNE